MNSARILLTRRLPVAVESRLAGRYDLVVNPDDKALSREALIEALGSFDVIVPTITDRIDAEMIGASSLRTRLLANFGAGIEHIDLNAARLAGIAVTNTPDALTDATAELAITLMLMAARRAGEGERQLRAGGWTGWHPTHLLGIGLNGRTLGLYGFGRIARATAQRASALGMHVMYHSRSRAPGAVEQSLNAVYVDSLTDLAGRCDVLSVHVPGGPETRHRIDSNLIARMRSDAIVVNTARGSIVDEAALAQALATRRIAAAGLDVFENEPCVGHRLLACENAVLLPHLGSATMEARTAMGMQAAHNIDSWFDGKTLPNQVA